MREERPQLLVLQFEDSEPDRNYFEQALRQNKIGKQFVVESFSEARSFRERLVSPVVPDIVVLDVNAGPRTDRSGIDLAAETRKAFPHCVLFMRSNFADSETVLECLNAGADDFLSKKYDKADLCLRLYQSYLINRLRRGGGQAAASKSPPSTTKVGSTLQTIAARIPGILSSAITTVHLSGESGTGKEAVADLFDEHMPTGTPFVRINCGAIAPALLESELFGYVKGSFTGATSDRKGLIAQANGGWVFLDEVATLSPSAQVALLRAIENQQVRPVGSDQDKTVEVRFLSATNESLEDLARSGKFRKDLWQRLCDVTLNLPPLRERGWEIAPLVQYFCSVMPGGPYTISVPALEILSAAPWGNGNVRELRNCLRAMTEFHIEKLLTPTAIPQYVWKDLGDPPKGQSHQPTIEPNLGSRLILELSQGIEPSYAAFDDALFMTLVMMNAEASQKISLSSLANSIGMSRSTFTDRIKYLMQRDLSKNEKWKTFLTKLGM